MERSIAHIESLDPEQLNSLDELDECATAVRAAVASGRRGGHCCSVHLPHDVFYRARGRYASTPLLALLVSPPEPHIPEHMGDTVLLSRVDRALWRGCASGRPWLQKGRRGRRGRRPNKGGDGLDHDVAAARHWPPPGAQPPAAKTALCRAHPAPPRCRASTRHYCLRPPPPPPPPPALTQTSIRPRRRRLCTLRHHPRAPLAASTLRPAGATSSMRPRPLHALQHGLCWCRRRPSRRLRICGSSLDRGHGSARRVRACLLRPAGPRASVQPAGASCAGGRGELWPARCP